jgi:acetoin utilization deacetylase AcuC-like enzyme
MVKAGRRQARRIASEVPRLALSHRGLVQRDRTVLQACKRRGIPVSMAIGGGYADPIEASVTAYTNTYQVAKDIHGF